jgi:stage V sporulation protein SpoVS
MRFPWWARSWTIWAGAIALAICFVPILRDFVHQAGIDLVKFQAVFHILLRFKTEGRQIKLSLKHQEGAK